MNWDRNFETQDVHSKQLINFLYFYFMLLLANTSKTKIMLGDQNLTSYNYSKNKFSWRDIECNKRFRYISSLSPIGFWVE